MTERKILSKYVKQAIDDESLEGLCKALDYESASLISASSSTSSSSSSSSSSSQSITLATSDDGLLLSKCSELIILLNFVIVGQRMTLSRTFHEQILLCLIERLRSQAAEASASFASLALFAIDRRDLLALQALLVHGAVLFDSQAICARSGRRVTPLHRLQNAVAPVHFGQEAPRRSSSSPFDLDFASTDTNDNHHSDDDDDELFQLGDALKVNVRRKERAAESRTAADLLTWGSSLSHATGHTSTAKYPRRIRSLPWPVHCCSVSPVCSLVVAGPGRELFECGESASANHPPYVEFTPSFRHGSLARRRVLLVSCSSSHALAVCGEGASLFSWGASGAGQLGLGRLAPTNKSNPVVSEPQRVPDFPPRGTAIFALAATEQRSFCCVTSDANNLYAFGTGFHNELGISGAPASGQRVDRPRVVVSLGPRRCMIVAANATHTLLAAQNPSRNNRGTVWLFGAGGVHRVVLTAGRTGPIRPFARVLSLATGLRFSAVSTADGRVFVIDTASLSSMSSSIAESSQMFAGEELPLPVEITGLAIRSVFGDTGKGAGGVNETVLLITAPMGHVLAVNYGQWLDWKRSGSHLMYCARLPLFNVLALHCSTKHTAALVRCKPHRSAQKAHSDHFVSLRLLNFCEEKSKLPKSDLVEMELTLPGPADDIDESHRLLLPRSNRVNLSQSSVSEASMYFAAMFNSGSAWLEARSARTSLPPCSSTAANLVLQHLQGSRLQVASVKNDSAACEAVAELSLELFAELLALSEFLLMADFVDHLVDLFSSKPSFQSACAALTLSCALGEESTRFQLAQCAVQWLCEQPSQFGVRMEQILPTLDYDEIRALESVLFPHEEKEEDTEPIVGRDKIAGEEDNGDRRKDSFDNLMMDDKGSDFEEVENSDEEEEEEEGEESEELLTSDVDVRALSRSAASVSSESHDEESTASGSDFIDEMDENQDEANQWVIASARKQRSLPVQSKSATSPAPPSTTASSTSFPKFNDSFADKSARWRSDGRGHGARSIPRERSPSPPSASPSRSNKLYLADLIANAAGNNSKFVASRSPPSSSTTAASAAAAQKHWSSSGISQASNLHDDSEFPSLGTSPASSSMSSSFQLSTLSRAEGALSESRPMSEIMLQDQMDQDAALARQLYEEEMASIQQEQARIVGFSGDKKNKKKKNNGSGRGRGRGRGRGQGRGRGGRGRGQNRRGRVKS